MEDYKMNEEFTSQKAQVRHHLLQGKSITPLEALRLCGSLRLSAIVFDLREEGLLIETERLQVSPKKRVARYYIKPENLNKQTIMENHETNNKPLSRKAQIRHYLLQGNSITELEALQKFNILHLLIIIYNLRKKDGLPILTEISPRNRVAKYYIDPKYLEEYNNNLNKK